MKSFFQNNILLFSLSLAYIILHVIFINQYGYFRDELYYIACSKHLAFGYVDQPPFISLVAALSRFLFGESLLAIRIFTVLAGGVVVLITGLTAKELGGSKYTQLLASLAVVFAPVFLFLFHVQSMNSFDFLFWILASYLLVKIIKTGNSRLWLLFGAIIGLGLENKLSIAFFLIGITAGLLLTRNRKYFKDKFLWSGLLISFLIFLPNIIWQIIHGFPTIEFMQNASSLKNFPVSPFDFIREQILESHPFSFLIMIAGLYYLFFTKTGKQYRIFGWMYLAIFILLVSTRSKTYYIAPVYSIMFAFGAIAVESFINRFNLNWLKPIIMVLLIIIGTMLAPLALPMLSVDTLINYVDVIGIKPERLESSEVGKLPQYYADMFGWENMANQVAKVYNLLPENEKVKCSIYAQNYGEAGAIDFFGIKYGLPPAICGHNSNWHWGYNSTRVDVLIAIGGRKEDHLDTFEEVTEVGKIINEYAMPYENNLTIYICRGWKRNIKEMWKDVRFYI